MPSGTIESQYIRAMNMPSDINEHMETLYSLATKCTFILECGVRDVVSTWAFMRGLRDNGSTDKVLYSSDLYRSKGIDAVEQAAGDITFKFIAGNDLDLDVDRVDMVFIDTWHVYAHLKRELSKFKDIATKYIVLHDTTVDAIHGESIRMGLDTRQQALDSGYLEEDIRKGLWPAIEEFIDEGVFRIKHRYTHNNGLTILERI